MATYVTYYQVRLTNNLHEDVDVFIQKKDGDPATGIQEYKVRDLKFKVNAQGDDPLFAPILSRELTLTFSVGEDDSDYWPDFANSAKDDWKIIVTVNTQFQFHGLVVPDEGSRLFQDPPYDATIKATDGLGLLKGVDLTDFEGQRFVGGKYTGITYIASALFKTGLDLPIRIYDSVYHISMLDRNSAYQYDMWGQALWDYRTFQRDPVEFYDCYEVLRRLINRSHRLFYQNGEYVIHRLSELQYAPAGNLYYTVYDTRGENPQGFIELENYGSVGKAEVLRLINKDAIQSAKFAMKSVKTSFDYTIWPELPANNKFERGNFVDEGIAIDESDLDGDGDFTEEIGIRKRYGVFNWSWGEFDINDAPLFLQNTGPVEEPLINKVENDFGTEILREISIPASPNAGGDGAIFAGLRAEAIPVVQGDRITFGLDKRYDLDIDHAYYGDAAIVWIMPDGGGDAYYLVFTAGNVPALDGKWSTVFLGALFIHFEDQDSRKYSSIVVESQPIPVTGNLHIMLVNRGPGPAIAYFRNFNFEYKPMVGGGFVKVKGEYVQRRQDGNFSDRSSENIYIADNVHKVFQGCILEASGVPTTPEWYRLGLGDERRQYKDLVNLGEYNLLYRRFWEIQGSLRGTTYRPQNSFVEFMPMGFHKPVRFEDIPGEHRQFVLVCPWDMNLMTGQSTATFAEILQASTESVDETETFDHFRGRIVNGINQVTAAQWDIENNAPNPQIGFPPMAYVYPGETVIIGRARAIGLIINNDDEMSVGGNGISVVWNTISFDGTHREQIFQFETEVLVEGDEYTFTAYGHTLIFIVGTVQVFDQEDGKQEGDEVESKLLF